MTIKAKDNVYWIFFSRLFFFIHIFEDKMRDFVLIRHTFPPQEWHISTRFHIFTGVKTVSGTDFVTPGWHVAYSLPS